MDMRAERDYDHVVALFRRGGCWVRSRRQIPPCFAGATRFTARCASSRCRICTSTRTRVGKNLRGYSRPFDLRRLAPGAVGTNEKNC